ncbi:MAG: hypothetical protein AAB634_02285 [Patescibacteria group bacterium]
MNNRTACGAVVHPAIGGVLLFVPPFIRPAKRGGILETNNKKLPIDKKQLIINVP